MGSAPSRSHRVGAFVKIDESHKRDFDGALRFGKIVGVCAALQRHNYEYTVQIEKDESECVEEQYIQELSLPEFEWVNPKNREVAVWVETHGDNTFVAELLRRDAEGLYEVRFVADGTSMLKVKLDQLSEPEPGVSLRNTSPEQTTPEPIWLLDRKVQKNIDVFWPMHLRIKEALEQLMLPRSTNLPPLRGPFVGKDVVDSEGFAAHPLPLAELIVDGNFVDTWGKYAGKLKFAPTYKIGPFYPRFDAWIDQVDAGEALYFHAALPVYAGLICIGTFQGKPEWIRATDTALVGIALYVNGELVPSYEQPEVEEDSLKKYGHDAIHFIPGCTSTYMVDESWVGATFTLAPAEGDFEVKDDMKNIVAYHQILVDEYNRQVREGIQTPTFRLQVNLVLATSYMANVRQVCCGAVTVHLTDRGMAVDRERIRHVLEYRMHSQAAEFAKRPRKDLMQEKFQTGVEHRLAKSIKTLTERNLASQASRLPPPPAPQALTLTPPASAAGQQMTPANPGMVPVPAPPPLPPQRTVEDSKSIMDVSRSVITEASGSIVDDSRSIMDVTAQPATLTRPNPPGRVPLPGAVSTEPPMPPSQTEAGSAMPRPPSAQRRPSSATRHLDHTSMTIELEPWQVAAPTAALSKAPLARGRSPSPANPRAPSPGITAARRRPLMDTAGLGGGSQQRASSRNR